MNSQQLRDWIFQLTGIYRLRALMRGGLIMPSARVISPSRLRLGRNVTVQRGAILHCGGKAWCGYGGYIHLDNGVVVGPYCVIYGAGGVELREYVHLGPGVKIMSQSGRHDRNRTTSQPTFALDSVVVGAGSWIGAGAVILGGSRIGRCVSVSPNSVVSGDVPDFAVVVGNPARMIFKNEANE
jgi:acetyltransferase-like isoleucine patch superfamily enzyme